MISYALVYILVLEQNPSHREPEPHCSKHVIIDLSKLHVGYTNTKSAVFKYTSFRMEFHFSRRAVLSMSEHSHALNIVEEFAESTVSLLEKRVSSM